MNKIYYERPNRPQNTNGQRTQNVKTIQKDMYTGNTEDRQENFAQADSLNMNEDSLEQQYYQPSYDVPVYDNVSKTEGSKNTRVKELIANIALIALSVILGLSLIGLLAEFRWVAFDYSHDESDLWYYIDKEYYAQVVDYKWENEALGVERTEELEQCYAVADYFEAASYYKAAVYNNDVEKMDEYVDKMQEAYLKLDDVAYLAENINAKLGIENPLE